MQNNKILVIDDEESIRFVFKKALEKKDFSVDLAVSGAEALAQIKKQDYLLAFLDLGLPDADGLEILKKIREFKAHLPVVIVTAKGTMQTTIEAIQRGAFDYITKPFDLGEIYILVNKILEVNSLKAQIDRLESELKEHINLGEIIGKSKQIQEIYKTIGRVSNRNVTVLIQGESGTGKELVARALHYHSARAAHPFIAVNCAAIPKELLESELFGHEKGAFTSAEGLKIGKFEQADKGTIFLDEIGDLEFNLQAKLLRILEDREVHRVGSRTSIKIDVRIIAATNQDLQTAVKEKRFREDLYHRINVINFSLPPLRDRREDISLLCDYFLQRFNREFNKKREPENMPVISAPVLMALKNYSWPGNIRELENVIKRAVVLCPGETIMTEHLPPVLSGGAEQQGGLLYLTWQITEKLKADLESNKVEANVYNRIILNVEKELFTLVMGFTANNQLKAAEILGINRNTLRKKLKEIEDEQL